jgi:hypothetical protein
MTRYTVAWAADVEGPFIDAWIAGDSPTRKKLTSIADWIDTNLSDFPDLKGEPIPDREARIVEVPVHDSTARVSAVYQVLPNDRLVRVIQIVFQSE